MSNNETSNETTAVATKSNRSAKFKKALTNPYVIALGTGAIGLGFGVAKALIEKKIAESTTITVTTTENYEDEFTPAV